MAEGEAAGAARTTAPAGASGTVTRRSARVLARQVASRVPTRYLTAIVTGLFLAATAAFGGLADAPPEPAPAPAKVGLDEAHDTGRYTVTFRHAVIVDEVGDVGVYPEEGERTLVLIADVTPAGPDPITYAELMTTFAGEELPVDEYTGDVSMQGSRYDDQVPSPALQPHVTTPLVLAWAVPEDRYAAGDVITFTLRDQRHQELSFLGAGTYWEETGETAIVTLEIEDLDA